MATDGPMPLLGFTFPWDFEGRMVFRGEGQSVHMEKISLWEQRNREFHRIPESALSFGLARRACPPQTAGPDLCLHLSMHRGKKTQRKGRKYIYIYIYIHIYI
jgi:hypothetical protein